MPALAYLLTFTTYGTRLPGSEKGWVDKRHTAIGSPALAPDAERENYLRSKLLEPPFVMDIGARDVVRDAIMSLCQYRNWQLHALHVRTNHVHAVISSDLKPERILTDCKAYATRALRSLELRERYWAKHGSTRYLWNQANLKAAIDYVLHGQGEAMACA